MTPSAGKTAKAEDINDLPGFSDGGSADLLAGYINKTAKPKMLFAWTGSSFRYDLPAKTPVSDPGGYLNGPDSGRSHRVHLHGQGCGRGTAMVPKYDPFMGFSGHI